MATLDWARYAILLLGSVIFGFNIAVFLRVDSNTRQYRVYKVLLAGRNGILLAVIIAAVGNIIDWNRLTIMYLYNGVMLTSLIVCGVCLYIIYKQHNEVIVKNVRGR